MKEKVRREKIKDKSWSGRGARKRASHSIVISYSVSVIYICMCKSESDIRYYHTRCTLALSDTCPQCSGQCFLFTYSHYLGMSSSLPAMYFYSNIILACSKVRSLYNPLILARRHLNWAGRVVLRFLIMACMCVHL